MAFSVATYVLKRERERERREERRRRESQIREYQQSQGRHREHLAGSSSGSHRSTRDHEKIRKTSTSTERVFKEETSIRVQDDEENSRPETSTSTSTSTSNNEHSHEDCGQELCRICLSEGTPGEDLESPCECKGSLAYVHKKCLQQWCSEKGDLICELCKSPYRGNYHVPTPRRSEANRESSFSPAFIGWLIPESAITNDRAQGSSNSFQSRICSKPLLKTYMILLVGISIIHTALVFVTKEDDDESPLSYLVSFTFRILIFFIPFLVVARIISTWQHYRRYRDEREPTIFFYNRDTNSATNNTTNTVLV